MLASKTESRWLRICGLTGLLVALSLALWWTPAIQELNRRITDSWFRLHSEQPSDDIVLVLIDDRSLEKYGRWPWSRTVLARLIDKVASQNPKVIGLDVLLAEPESELADGSLTESMRRVGNVVLVDKISGSETGPLWVEPLPRFAQIAAGTGHAQALLDSDGVCRRFPLAELSLEGPRLAFGIEVAQQANPEAVSSFITANAKRSGQTLLHEEGNLEAVSPLVALIAFRRTAGKPPFSTYSAVDLLDDRVTNALRGKIVMLGFGSGDIHDRLVTPVSGTIPSPGVEIHAQIVDAIISNRFLAPVSTWLQVLILTVISSLVVVAGIHYHPAKGLTVALAVALLMYVIGYIDFASFGRVVDAGMMMCTVLLAVPLVQLEKLLRIERSVTRQLRGLRASLLTEITVAPRAREDVHWKLQTLEKLQNQLRSMYEFEHALLETTQDCIAVFAASGEMSFCNTGFREMWNSVQSQSKARLQDFLAWAEGGGSPIESDPTHLPFAGERLLGGKLWGIRLTQVNEADDSRDSVMLVMSDLQARMERDRSRAEAIAFGTHELRTPLVAIQGLAELMVRFPGKTLSNDAPEVIFRESRRLVALINSYLDVLRLDSGARPLHREPTDANEIVRHVAKVLQPLADSNRTRLQVIESPGNPTLVCDSALLTGALMNLASNSIKYGGEQCEVTIVVSTSQSDLVYSVWNSGRYIPPQEVDRLFDPYFRGSADRDQGPGWGLGLAFVKRMVDQHQGRVVVQSSEGRGTEFRIVFPGSLDVVGKEVRSS